MYPAGFSTYVDPPQVAEPWDGICRPGHFRGVATVVLKLFNIAPCDRAYFGQKDFQQALVIRRMVADLNVPIEIRVCPIVREPDGLALSSRNVYLSPEQRQRSLSLSRALQRAQQLVERGERNVAVLEEQMREQLTGQVTSIDYVAVADPETLQPVAAVDGPAVALIAARVGGTRLIDNHLFQ
jgi:pantoate--beta-alanine ligase